MTVGEWLRQRSPRPPAVLAARIDDVLGALLNEPSEQVSEVLLRAGEQLVSELRIANCTSRDSALDLLTADALVTYAFEGAGSSPEDIELRAVVAMKRIALLGTAEPAGA